MFLILLLLAGGGLYAAGDGLLGVVAQAKVEALKADVEAELKKAEVAASADVKKVVAAVRAKL